MPPESWHISGTTRPTEMVHLLKFTVLKEQTDYSLSKRYNQTLIAGNECSSLTVVL